MSEIAVLGNQVRLAGGFVAFRMSVCEGAMQTSTLFGESDHIPTIDATFFRAVTSESSTAKPFCQIDTGDTVAHEDDNPTD
jgi:hypothetical protein